MFIRFHEFSFTMPGFINSGVHPPFIRILLVIPASGARRESGIPDKPE